ncbi:cation:dicarboxylate symporter family transporter [Bacillus hominis]|uniref:cation:dicarboxylate symporter family transporter n=1 Tax=Bacillus hominis TaxID=2817478 RepID=UPI003D65DAC4
MSPSLDHHMMVYFVFHIHNLTLFAYIRTASVPGVGLVILTMVLNQVNLPVEGIALIIGIDRILDMSRTAVNIYGDAICVMIVAKSEEKYNTNQSAVS